MMTIIDKIKAKIRRRKPYKTIPDVAMEVESYIKTHNMNRKGADERLEAFYDKTVKKYKNTKSKYTTIKTTALYTGEKHTVKLGTKQVSKLEQLQRKANLMAKQAGLPYSYNFHFKDKAGYKKYVEYLEKITKDNSFFEARATERLYTFIENTKRMFEIYKNTTTDENLKILYDKVLTVLNDKSTDYKKLYERLKGSYDTSELSVYLFSSDVQSFELQGDSQLLSLIESIVGEE